MKASEAKRISEENEISLEEIFSQIENSASNRDNHCVIFCYVSPLKIGEIISEGYKVSQFTDQMGTDCIKIQW